MNLGDLLLLSDAHANTAIGAAEYRAEFSLRAAMRDAQADDMLWIMSKRVLGYGAVMGRSVHEILALFIVATMRAIDLNQQQRWSQM